ncbi:MAG: prolyl oligopeptidase family serine peptidase [Nitrososphaeraceae archaeon]|nr:prolyl oligopeptidase family serine peptidase [Nitrososphaeraceae archaeon]
MKSLLVTISIIFLLSLTLYSISSVLSGNNFTVLAQQDLQTIKYRDLVIDLGNGVKTNAQLTIPAVGNGPFPGVLLIQGSGAVDMNGTEGFIRIDNATGTKIYPSGQLTFEISQYLSERGFEVLRYDKRGVSSNYTVLNTNVWGNATANDYIRDGKKALNVLLQQPEVDPKRINIIGHSEGTIYAPRVALDNSTNVKNIILMAVLAQNPTKAVEYYQDVSLPLEYASQVLDRNKTGMISIQQIANDPLLRQFLVPSSVMLTNNTEAITTILAKDFGTSDYISIEKQLKPLLVKGYENITSFRSLECNHPAVCPVLWKSLSNLPTNLGIIGNVSQSTGILILNGENDTQTPVQQAFLLQQRLTDVNHPDHTLITYPNLGHVFYPSSEWKSEFGPIQQYVLRDLYSWLESHNGFTPLATSNLPSSSFNSTKLNN